MRGFLFATLSLFWIYNPVEVTNETSTLQRFCKLLVFYLPVICPQFKN
jgi:hypothetical protein